MSDRTLQLKPSGLPEVKNRPWALVLRSHDLSGTEYETIALLTDETAEEVQTVSRYGIHWTYGNPDWDERERKRKLERVRVMREEADKIEAAAKANVVTD